MLDTCRVYELRQYALYPNQRDVLVDVFDREFIESQEALGIRVVGQFRDVDDPDRFVWFRGFADMQSRRESLTAFYGGPVWAAHRGVANPTMRSFDEVLLLRPVAGHDFPPAGRRPGPGATAKPESLYAIQIFDLDAPLHDRAQEVSELLAVSAVAAGGRSVAVLETEAAKNDYTALPVQEGRQVLVHVTRHPGPEQHARWTAGGDGEGPWQEAERQIGTPVALRLAPTARSCLA